MPPPARLLTVDETSAGGLVVDRLDLTDPIGPSGPAVHGVLIARRSRKGALEWVLPKGHLEPGETIESAAVREVEEETGIRGDIVGTLGSIDYWFVADARRIHKTVHLFLLQAVGGELSDADIEVQEVEWVPIAEVPQRLAYADEREAAARAVALLTRPGEGG